MRFVNLLFCFLTRFARKFLLLTALLAASLSFPSPLVLSLLPLPQEHLPLLDLQPTPVQLACLLHGPGTLEEHAAVPLGASGVLKRWECYLHDGTAVREETADVLGGGVVVEAEHPYREGLTHFWAALLVARVAFAVSFFLL